MNVTSKIPFTATRRFEDKQARVITNQDLSRLLGRLESVNEVPVSRVNARPVVIVPVQQSEPRPRKGFPFGVDPTTPIIIR